MIKRITFFLTVSMFSLSFAQLVTNKVELEMAISNASAGSVITLKNGVWKDTFIDVNKNGAMGNPIVIKAETSGAVFLEGNSKANIKGSYIIFTGVIFQNASGLVSNKGRIDPVIKFDKCNDCILTDVKIDSYNGTTSQELDTFKWILTDGLRNEISYCSFIGKKGIGSIINDNRNTAEEDFLKIHHNYFADRTPVTGGFNGKNDQDAIRIGNSATSLSDSSSEVYENYFFNFSGEIEVISNKSGNNKYYNNTFRDYQGSLTLRHGDNCEVYGNFFFGENNPSASGVRVIGEGHKIYNNYFEGLNYKKPNGNGSNATGGINVSNGRVNTALNGYFQVKDALIINNTFVDCDMGIRVGTKVKSDLSLAPINITIGNNILLNSSNKAIQEVTTPINGSKYEGNITQNGSWDIDNSTPNNNNQLVNSGLLSTGTNFYKLALGSAAKNSGIGAYNFLSKDILGGNRSSNYDAGAEEFESGGSRLPFKASDVGTIIGFGTQPFSPEASLSISKNTLDFSKLNANKTFAITSNVNWEITETSAWITVNPISGSSNQVVTVSVSENNTGQERRGTITVSESEGDLSEILNINQSTISFNPENAMELIPENSTAVGTQSPNIPENTLDKNDNTRWSASSTNGSAYITYDLGCEKLISSVKIKFFKGNERTSTFQILQSNDGTSFSEITPQLTSAGNTIDFENFDLPFPYTTARYIQIAGYGNSGPAPNNVFNSYVEVAILGESTDCSVLGAVPNKFPKKNSVKIFPVPSKGSKYLTVIGVSNQKIYVYDVLGKIVSFKETKKSLNSIKLNVSNFNKGIYFLKIENFGSQKFIIN